jgi:hypothetical protein
VNCQKISGTEPTGCILLPLSFYDILGMQFDKGIRFNVPQAPAMPAPKPVQPQGLLQPQALRIREKGRAVFQEEKAENPLMGS